MGFEREPFERAPSVYEESEVRKDAHYEELQELGWEDIDSIKDIEDPSLAFRIGRARGAQQEASLFHRILSKRATAIYFEDIEGLEEKLERYSMHLFVSNVSEHDTGVLEISIGEYWIDVGDLDIPDLIERLNIEKTDEGKFKAEADTEDLDKGFALEVMEKNAYPVGQGYIVDFGSPDEVNSARRKAKRELKESF